MTRTMNRWIGVALALSFAAVLGLPAHADSLDPAFSGSYTLTDIGAPAGLTQPFGGMVFLNNNTVLIGANANTANGEIDQVGVSRDGSGHINGFSGPATFYAKAPYIDGGLVFAPNGDLLFTGFPNNTLGEIKPGSTSPDKTLDLTTVMGTASNESVGALQFGPDGSLKIVEYVSADFYSTTLALDGSGTYDLTGITPITNLSGFPNPAPNPEGFIYVPGGSPGFSGPSMLMNDWLTGQVIAYSVDANGNPNPASAATFASSLSGAEGAVLDPLTNDFVFSTFGVAGVAGDHVDVVTGFTAPVPEPTSLLLLGTGLLGLGWRISKSKRS